MPAAAFQQKQRKEQEAQQSGLAALQRAGVAPEIAKAAVLNPEIMKGILANALDTKTTFGIIGKDELGREQYGFIHPGSQKVTPFNPSGSGSGPTGTAIDATVDAILEGRMQPPTSFAASKPYWQGILAKAAEKEPGFDLTRWQQRVGTAKDFASGQAAKNVTSLNTVIGHLDTVREAADKLDNSRIPLWNTITNAMATGTGDERVKGFLIARNAVADELARVFRQAGMSDTEIRSWKETLDDSNSPKQFKEVIGRGVDLLNSRLDALKDQYQRGMNKAPPELLSPKAQKTLENVNKWVLGTPSQSSSPVAAPQDGATAINPKTGERLMLKGGKWVPFT